MKHTQACRGEAAIAESVIILPLITLTLLAICICSICLCDRICMESLCEKYALLASDRDTYYGISEDCSYPASVRALMEREKNPYVSPDYGQIFGELENKLEKEAEEKSLFKKSVVSVSISKTRNFASDFVCVSIVLKYGNTVFSRFIPEIHVCSVNRLSNVTELLRNLDMINDAIDSASAYVKNSETLKKALEGISGTK